MTLVTAIIPAFNASAHLADALESVAAQSEPVAEVVVVDDGSEDDSAAIARKAGATVLATAGRFGAAAARNLAARYTKTPYLAFLDADDLWLPSHCESLLSILTDADDAALAFGRCQRFGEKGEIPTPAPKVTLREKLPVYELLWDNPIVQSATLVRRTIFLEAGGYREEMRHAEDYDLWLRLAQQHRFVGSGQVTCRSRIHAAQVSSTLVAMIRGGWAARLAACERLDEVGRFDGRAHDMLLRAFEDDEATAWTEADSESLRTLLEIAPRVPGSDPIARRIETRLRLVGLRRMALGMRRRIRGR
jgi:glycosyltransferase involved in cell wall biosynthesis